MIFFVRVQRDLSEKYLRRFNSSDSHLDSSRDYSYGLGLSHDTRAGWNRRNQRREMAGGLDLSSCSVRVWFWMGASQAGEAKL